MKKFIFILFLFSIIQVVNAKSVNNLMESVKKGKKELVELALITAQNINCKDQYGETLLMIAVRHNYIDIVKLLLENNVKLNIRNKRKNTALCIASRRGYNKIVELLLKAGADIDLSGAWSETPLVQAVRKFPSTALILVNNGADLNIKNHAGETALTYAIKYRHYNLLRILTEAGADLNITKFNPLLWAVSQSNHEFVQLFINSGANVNYSLDKKNDILLTALKKKDKFIIRHLVEAGVKIKKEHVSYLSRKHNNELIEILKESQKRMLFKKNKN